MVDYCCGAGAVSIGYYEAGFDVIGCDIEPQPNYPFPFVRADGLEAEGLLAIADAAHASAPCLRDTAMRHAPGAKGDAHPLLIPGFRAMLKRSGKPYVMENVMGAEMENPIVFNGFMFKLGTNTSDGTRYHLERKRKIEANWPLMAPSFVPAKPIIGVYGAHIRCRAAGAGGRGTRDFIGEDKPRLMREAMGIDPKYGFTMAEMSQMVPPAYTKEIGTQLLRYLATAPGRIFARISTEGLSQERTEENVGPVAMDSRGSDVGQGVVKESSE